MQAPRGSFFTTVGYLASKPSNFLETNNNYGRAALMSFVVSGEVLSAATDGPKGESQTKPLPTCLKTRDIRGTLSGQNFAPHGSAAVPLFGNVCQSCHISRHMASGSLLFRPFKSSGMLFSADQLVETDPLVVEATKPGQVVKDAVSDASVPVTLDFLKSLLVQDGSEQACLIGNAPGAAPEVVTSVKGLAERLALNDRDLAKGLARHFPRALSNLSSTTLEIQNRMIETYEKKGGKIVPLVEAYFGSETYACENRD
ncbi:MAG: hypothetical protein ING65_10955 [Rhodocyclaceae bacterium]|nr:hypothetical protein [Rhodocyclaceae bacterium]